MGCGEPPLPGSLLETCREPDSPHLIAVRPPGPEFDVYAQYVIALDANQVGEIAEAAASRFLERAFGLQSLIDHPVNAPGVDHLMITATSMLVVGETKGTAGLTRRAQAANLAAKAEHFPSLLGRSQTSPEWVDRDATMSAAGLSSEQVTGVVGCRVDLLSQSIDVWERNDSGGWDHIGTWHCPTADLVEAKY